MNNSKNRILIFLVVFLLLTNIGMLIYYTGLNKKPARENRTEKRGPISTFLQNDVGFDKAQMDMLDSLKKQHRAAIRPLFDELGKSKDNFYQRQSVSASSIADQLEQSGNDDYNTTLATNTYYDENSEAR